MHVFLNGGGAGPCAGEAYRRFGAAMDKKKPLLYVPLAMEPAEYPGCLQWITGEWAGLGVEIRMATSAEELAGLPLEDFGGIFIGGGNTFTLLKRLKDSGAFAKLGAYLKSGGPIFGGSAGAIVLGADITSCACADENLVGLKDTRGLDVLGGVSLLCHYGSEGEEGIQKQTGYLLKLSQAGQRVLALPEEDTLVVEGARWKLLGDKPCYLFAGGSRREIEASDLGVF